MLAALLLPALGMAQQRFFAHRGGTLTNASRVLSPALQGNLMRPTTLFGARKNQARMAAPWLADATTYVPTLMGIVYDGYEATVSSFKAEDPIDFNIVDDRGFYTSSGGAVYANGKFYVNTLQAGLLETRTTQRIYDAETWTLLETRDLAASASATVLAYDPTEDRVYGQFYDDEMQNLQWGWMDRVTGRSETVNQMEDRLYALAVANDGTMYAIDPNGALKVIDKKTGRDVRVVANTGITPKYIQSATFDKQTNRMYWCAVGSDYSAGLYTLDLTTGKPSLVASFPNGEEVTGVYIPFEAYDGAPAKIADAAINFANNALSGTVGFHTPQLTESGSALTGSLTAYVVVGTDTTALSVEPDKDYTVNVSVPESGMTTFRVFTENATGESRQWVKEQWIGVDKPNKPTNIVLTKEGDKAIVHWEAPTTTVHNGYIDPSLVTYTVLRMARRLDTVAVQQKATQFEETIAQDDMANINYIVIPYYKGERGEMGYSNNVIFGSAFEVPASIYLSRPDEYELCTVIDANNDGNTWQWMGCARYEGTDEKDADDWLVTPGFHFLPSKYYDIEYTITSSTGFLYPEVYELNMGKEPTVAELSKTTIVRDTVEETLTNDHWVSRQQRVSVDEEGNFHLGFHVISPAGKHQLMLGAVSVTEGPSFAAPDSVKNLRGKAGEEGALTATLTFTLPATTANGASLTALGKVEVYRGDDLIGTLTDRLQPGSELSFTDSSSKQGFNDYRVVCYNTANEAGDAATVRVYVGEDRPCPPSNVLLSWNDGKAHIQWDAPTTGAAGGYINPANLTYGITGSLYEGILESGIKDTFYDFDYPTDNDAQEIIYYGVFAQNIAGISDGTSTNSLMIGKPYTLPFDEQFTNGAMSYGMWYVGYAAGESTWDMSKKEGHKTIGCPLFSGGVGDGQMISTGMIDLGDAENPVLTFWTVANNDQDKLVVEITDDFEKPYQEVYTVDYSDQTPGEWSKVSVPLSDWKGKPYIYIGFHSYTNTWNSSILFDDVNVRDVHDYDLAVTSISSSADKVEVGKTTSTLSVEVENQGKENVAATDYSVDIYQGNQKLTSLDGADLASDGTHTFTYVYSPKATDDKEVKLHAVINYAADENPDNDQSGEVMIRVTKPAMPAVDDLAWGMADGQTYLAWSQPDLNGTAAQVVTDGFEDYEAFTISDIGDWTLRDVDGQNTCAIQGAAYKNMGSPMAFQVFNPSKVYTSGGSLTEKTAPHNGDQYLITFAIENARNNDWLISPKLSGAAQTMSFYGKSVTNLYGLEEFEVYYSTTDTALTSMKQLVVATEVPAEWTQFSYELPEGAKYFAIRCVSDYRFALMLDDITYEAAAQPLVVKFVGYNVYRNGEKVNAEPLTTPRFSEPFVKDAEYTVTVVYDLGESVPSNSVIADPTGVTQLEIGMDNDVPTYQINGVKAKTQRHGQVYVKRGKKFVKK